MKKLLFISLLLFALFPVTAFASPFLVCDPQAEITQYELEINGTVTSGIVAEADGSIRHDLAGFEPGAYTFRARCADVSGWWSDWSIPFDGMKPAAPFGLRVSSE